MKTVALTHHQVALVSDEDFEWVAQFKWFAKPWTRKRPGFYAVRYEGLKTIYMHRELLAASEGVLVDHADGDGLNNQRSNIRLCDKAKNTTNAAMRKNKNGLRGVSKISSGSGYRAFITTKVDRWCGPRRTNPIQAAIDYDREAIRRWGQFARPNFPCIAAPRSPGSCHSPDCRGPVSNSIHAGLNTA